ncbi:MAG TPA: hypothetical protein PLP33_27700 [Leptospiraceae bacterium]|nr:hypothetical protein [Leptospiraceae bacterium]
MSGCSGTGKVAHVFELPGSAALVVWGNSNTVKVQSVAVYSSLQDLIAVHGHDGRTVLVPENIFEVELSEVFEVLDKAHENFMALADAVFDVEHFSNEEDSEE